MVSYPEGKNNLIDDSLFNLLSRCSVLIQNVGFPIFVALYVLIITNKQIKLLTMAINRLTSAFDRARILDEQNEYRPPKK